LILEFRNKKTATELRHRRDFDLALIRSAPEYLHSGPMHNAPMPFVASIMNALAEATMDFMIQDPANAKKHCKAGFDALWRAIV
jgi:hypothetical protein